MNDLTRLSAEERQQMIDEFVDAAFDGIDPDAQGAGIAQAMRSMPAAAARRPDHRAGGGLDRARRARVRAVLPRPRARDGDDGRRERTRPSSRPSPTAVIEQAGAALAAGVEPGTPAAEEVVARLVPADLDGRRAGGARRPARHLHRPPRRALLAAPGRAQRLAAAGAVGARVRVADRGPARVTFPRADYSRPVNARPMPSPTIVRPPVPPTSRRRAGEVANHVAHGARREAPRAVQRGRDERRTAGRARASAPVAPPAPRSTNCGSTAAKKISTFGLVDAHDHALPVQPALARARRAGRVRPRGRRGGGRSARPGRRGRRRRELEHREHLDRARGDGAVARAPPARR